MVVIFFSGGEGGRVSSSTYYLISTNLKGEMACSRQDYSVHMS